MLLKRSGIQHMVRSVATITNCRDIVLVGSGALIAAVRHLPAELMQTNEVDLYVRDASDPEDVQQLIEGTLGEGTYFQKTFRYHVDAVSARTAVFPADWQTRASELPLPTDRNVKITCPSADDLAISKCVAWRDKDKSWLKACALHGFIDLDRMRELAAKIDPADLDGLEVAHVIARIDHIPVPPART